MLEDIKKLVESLSERDKSIAKKYIDKRDYVSLKELVDSSIKIYEKNLKKAVPNEELFSLNTEDLMQLKTTVDAFVLIIDPDYDIYGEDDYD